MENAQLELAQWQEMQQVAESISIDAKAEELQAVLKQGFSLMKKAGAKRRVVIFTESVETQKMLQQLLSKTYNTICYNGRTDYSVIQKFKEDGEVLIFAMYCPLLLLIKTTLRMFESWNWSIRECW